MLGRLERFTRRVTTKSHFDYGSEWNLSTKHANVSLNRTMFLVLSFQDSTLVAFVGRPAGAMMERRCLAGGNTFRPFLLRVLALRFSECKFRQDSLRAYGGVTMANHIRVNSLPALVTGALYLLVVRVVGHFWLLRNVWRRRSLGAGAEKVRRVL